MTILHKIPMKPILQTATTSYVHISVLPLTCWIFSCLVCLCLPICVHSFSWIRYVLGKYSLGKTF